MDGITSTNQITNELPITERPSYKIHELGYDSVLTIKTSKGNVPLYKMIEKFLYIEDEDGNRIKLIMNYDQVELYIEMCEQRLKRKPIRLNILKARRIGFSTIIAAIIFCSVAFNKGQKAAIVADIAEHASNLFAKYQYFYDNLPEEMKPKKIASNAKELIFGWSDGQRSSIRVMVQGDNAGRSGTYQYLHLSECAFWDDLKATLISLLQTVSPSNLNSMVFLETTANGFNEYKTRYDNDVANGDTKLYKALFYAWWSDKKCQKKDDEILLTYEDLLPFEKEIMEKYKLTMNQIAWYDEKYYGDCDRDLSLLRQEYPSNPTEAFVTSGNSVFNSDSIATRKEELAHKRPLKMGYFSYIKETSKDGNLITLKDTKWVETERGDIKIYEEVQKGYPYVVVMDSANGGEDYYVIHVINNYTCHQAAVFRKNKCDFEFPSIQMYLLAKKYNDALITAETNTPTGTLALQMCFKLGYRFIYQDNDLETISTRFADKYGYKTKTTNRDAMISMFAVAFREDRNIINDYDTICEMESFQITRTGRSGIEKAQATGGAHDDLVMAYCGFFLCRAVQRATPIEAEIVKRDTIEELEYKLEQKRMRNANKNNRSNVYQIWD